MKLFKKIKVSNILASFAVLAATISTYGACLFIIYQPKAPSSLKKLRKH